MSICKIALAIPLVLGIGCVTTGGHGVDTTGAMWTDGEGGLAEARLPRDAATQAYMQATGAGKDQGSPGAAVSPDTSSGSSGSTGSTGSSHSSDAAGSSGSTGASDAQGSSGSAGSDSPGATGSTGSSDQSPSGAQGSGGAMGSADQGSTSGTGDVKGHADDQTVRGKLSKVSKEEVSITPKGGEAKTLKISPQTIVTINGKDAKPTQLKQGQQVRASYQSQDGDDVAVKIEVGKARQGKSSGQMKGRGGHTDHSGHGHGGSMGGAGGTGTGGGSR